MNQPEYALHVACADYLRAVLPPEVLWFHVPNGEVRSKIAGARLKRMGVRPGVADLMIAWFTRHETYPTPQVLWIECKSSIGRLSPEQMQFSYDISIAGHYYTIARSLRDVEVALQNYRIPTRGKIAA